MSDEMKVILEGWRETLKEYTPDHKKRKEDLLAPLKQKAQDKASRHIAQAVAGERPSGKVYPGTESGAKDVEALLNFHQELEAAMEAVGAEKPEDLGYEIQKELALLLIGAGVGKLAYKIFPKIRQAWSSLKNHPFFIKRKTPGLEKWAGEVLTTSEDALRIPDLLQQRGWIKEAQTDETK